LFQRPPVTLAGFFAGNFSWSLCFEFENGWSVAMPNPTFKRWTADEIAKLKNLAQKQSRKAIAAELGRSVSATAVKAPSRCVAKITG
jgi:hypothetical protein